MRLIDRTGAVEGTLDATRLPDIKANDNALTDKDVRPYRELFPFLDKLTYFNHGSIAPISKRRRTSGRGRGPGLHASRCR